MEKNNFYVEAPLDEKGFFTSIEAIKAYVFQFKDSCHPGQMFTVLDSTDSKNPVKIFKLLDMEGNVEPFFKNSIKIWFISEK